MILVRATELWTCYPDVSSHDSLVITRVVVLLGCKTRTLNTDMWCLVAQHLYNMQMS